MKFEQNRVIPIYVSNISRVIQEGMKEIEKM